MKLIITLRKISDTSFHREYEFSEFPVKLGRETDNDVVLEDPRKIISRSHAKIEDNDGLIQVLDSGSANFTYLNGEKLFPNDGNALKTGDVIKIGDYELDVVLETLKKEVFFDDQKTMVFSSPFDSDVQKVADSITKLSEKYFYDESPLKSEMLRISIMQNIGRLTESDVSRILSEYFADKFPGKSQIKKDFSQLNIPVEDKPKVKAEPQRVYADLPKSTPDYSFTTHFSETVDIMLDTIIKL
ncbi:MAG: FHA domain-containing protein, partial [Ignavibacteriales bacterium]